MKGSWPEVSLGELVRLERRPIKVIPNQQYQEIGIYCFGRGIFHKAPRTGFEVGAKDLFLLKHGDLILQVTFAWEGAVALVSVAEDGMYGSSRYPTFRVDENRCIPEFLLHYFKTSTGLQQLIRISPGSAGRNRVLSIKRIPEVLIPLPKIAEQRQILSRVEALATKVNEATILRRQTTAEAAAIIKARLNLIISRLIDSHETSLLEQITNFIGDMNHEMPSAVETGIPFISPKDFISEGRIDFTTAKKISQSDFERLSIKCRPRVGDILMARYGTVGQARIVETDAAFLASYSIAVIRPDKEKIERRFLYWMVVSPSVQEQLLASVRGGVQADVGLKSIRQLRVPVPPLPVQNQIASELDQLQAALNSLQRLQEETTAELKAFMPSILDKAFRGEL